ncbi:MAG TPA: folate-binding protein [Alphaproteobacteria bacterium]|nr:folate-binding protein [Alphaproteobacteria bacterium]
MEDAPHIARLESRAILRIEGQDCVSFLQNLISQDMAAAVAGQPIFTALLTPQGKYLFDFFILPESANSFLLDVEAERRTEFITQLGRFHIRGDVKMRDVQDDYAVYALWGRQPAKGFADPRLAALGRRLLAKKEEAVATNANERAYRKHRYRFGVAEGSHEITVGKATLAEVNFDALNAISFEKGCYMGQELTARTHYRGLAKRRYLPFRVEGPAPEKFTRILHGGFEIGEVRAIEDDCGLGLFHLQAVQPFLNGAQMLIHDGITYDVQVPDYIKTKVLTV